MQASSFVRGAAALLTVATVAACATAPDAPSSEAAAVENPKYPGIAAMAWTFRDGQQLMCGVSQDKGVLQTPAKGTTKFTLLVNAAYSFIAGSQNDAGLNLIVKDGKVYGAGADGKPGVLNDHDAAPILNGLSELRGTCGNMIATTAEALKGPLGGALRPAVITFGTEGKVAQVAILAK